MNEGSKQQKDPVCGMPVKKDGEWTSDYNGTQIAFCSPKCKAEFDENPRKYKSKAA